MGRNGKSDTRRSCGTLVSRVRECQLNLAPAAEGWCTLQLKAATDMFVIGFAVENLSELKELEFYFRIHEGSSSLVTFVARIRGTFREGFELKHFPFDRQWLTSRFTSRVAKVRFVNDWPQEWGQKCNYDHVAVETFILDEWDLGQGVCLKARPSFASVSFHVRPASSHRTLFGSSVCC